MSKEKVVLAYSGGLDTTAIIPWLKETFNYDVICCCIDCGQGEELDGLDERLRLHVKKALLLSAMVQQEKEMTRSVSSLVSKLLLRTSRSSLHGV